MWKEPVKTTLNLLEEFCNDDVCAFNLSFDWFHIVKLYNLFHHITDKTKAPDIQEVIQISERFYKGEIPRTDFICLKPKRALDLFLHSRKTEWQNLMDRRNIVIRRVPKQLIEPLKQYLTKHLSFDPIFFYKSQEGYHWEIDINSGKNKTPDPDFPNLVLKFKPSGGLKPLSQAIFKVKTYEYPVPKELYPKEEQYNPYISGWPEVIEANINYWARNKNATAYATDDIILLERLYHHFGCPTPGDNDSELACCVGAVRWFGYSIDALGIAQRLLENLRISQELSREVNIDSPLRVKQWLKEGVDKDTNLSDMEKNLAKIGIVNTSEEVLTKLKEMYGDSELGKRAAQILRGRTANKEITILQRLDNTGTFNPDFKVIGAKSGRMSGGGFTEGRGSKSGSINPQGIQRDKTFRRLFLFAFPGYITSGGDFESFEVAITHGQCRDSNLERDLRSGKSFHAIFGSSLFKVSYDQILSSKGKADDLYSKAKTSVFAMFYGAREERLARTAGVHESEAEHAIKELSQRYPDWAKARRIINRAFCAMQQPGGIGTNIEWNEPAPYIESLLGFRRYFNLENKICRFLFELAQDIRRIENINSTINASNTTVKRSKDRTQTALGATQTALYSCAFQLQASNMRAAANHIIQSTGAEICKALQRSIWDLQPPGVNKFHVAPMNIHDEIITVHLPELTDTVELIALKLVEVYREVVPLLELEWKRNINNWSEK